MLINLFVPKKCLLTLIILLSLLTHSYATEILPSGCAAVVIKNDTVIIPAEKYVFLFLHNLSGNDVWLVQQAETDGLSSSLSSKMVSGTWSGLVLNKQSQEIKFSCIESKPGHEQKISCQDVLAICEWPHAKIPENKKGIFFVAESVDLSGLTAYSERNGYSIS